MFTGASRSKPWGFGECAGRDRLVLHICGRPLQGRPLAARRDASRVGRRPTGAKRIPHKVNKWIASIRHCLSPRISDKSRLGGREGTDRDLGFARFFQGAQRHQKHLLGHFNDPNAGFESLAYSVKPNSHGCEEESEKPANSKARNKFRLPLKEKRHFRAVCRCNIDEHREKLTSTRFVNTRTQRSGNRPKRGTHRSHRTGPRGRSDGCGGSTHTGKRGTRQGRGRSPTGGRASPPMARNEHGGEWRASGPLHKKEVKKNMNIKIIDTHNLIMRKIRSMCNSGGWVGISFYNIQIIKTFPYVRNEGTVFMVMDIHCSFFRCIYRTC